ncbi:MAG: hypothetical protein QOE45_1722 [Frankiaceae bacterium]|nr:hypothetical protein [Frankiaceae bacterium]
MLATAFRDGLGAVRRVWWRAFGVALLSYLPLALLGSVLGGALLSLGLVLHVLVTFALARLVAAARAEPLPPVPRVDELGRRVEPPRNAGPPLTPEDASPVTALRNAFRLWRPAVRVTGLYLLAGLAAGLTVVALSGGRFAEYGPNAQLVAVLPVSAVFTAFVVLAVQRVALEGDTRVLVAAAHSARIARTAYGVLLLLAIAEPAVAVGGSLLVSGDHPPVGRVVAVGLGTLLLAAFVKVLVTAVANEVYARGPRLDLPVDAEP